MSLGCRTFWRSKIWAAAMMLAPVMVLSGCDDKAAGEQQAGAGIAVDVVQVMPQNVPLTFEFAARAQGSKETEVRARVGGILLKRNYVEGAEVSEGQVLFEIDPDTYRVALNQAKAKLAQTEAELKMPRRSWRVPKSCSSRGMRARSRATTRLPTQTH